MVILKKGLSPRTLRFLQAAELIGGPGHGWATRFVGVVEKAGEASPAQPAPPELPKVSVTRMHNLLGGHREVTPALESLITRLAGRSIRQMEENAKKLRALAAEIEAEADKS